MRMGTHPDGNIIIFPAIAWSTATAMNGSLGLLRVEYVDDLATEDRRGLQLALAAEQVRQLSHDLALLADRLSDELATDKPEELPS